MATADSRTRPSIRYLQLASAFIGIVLSLYLLAQHTRLKSGIQGGSSFCSFGKYADCDVVSSSQYSEVLGVPLAGIGAVFYFVLLLLSLITPRKPAGYPHSQTWIARLAFLALGIDTVLLGVQLFLIHSFCLLCCATYLASLGVLFAAIKIKGGRFTEALTTIGSLDEEGDRLMPKAPMPIILGILLAIFVVLVSYLPSVIRLDSKNYALVDGAIEQFFATWPEKKARVIDYKPGDGTLGNPNAPVRIVEFSDFECPYCRQAAFTLHAALEPLKEDVFFVFKQYPLDKACNPTVEREVHPNACALARLAFCANQKGKFWEFHDTIFMKLTQEQISGGVGATLKGLEGLFTQAEIDSCLVDPAGLDNIKQDAKLGRSLELRGTPTVYVNGKTVTIPLTVDNLRRLVELEKSLQPKTSP